MGFRNYSVSNGFVVAKDNTGDFTTIQSAITAASSGQTIFVRDGTYTENLTLKAGVDITALGGDSNEPNVTIIGKCSYTGTGTTTISNVKLQTNSDFAVAVTGSAASVLVIVNCVLIGSNNTIISYTTSNASSQISLSVCTVDLTTTGIAYFSMSSTGSMVWDWVLGGNSGSSTTNATQSAGTLTIRKCVISCDITTSGTGQILVSYSQLGRGAGNTTALTHGSSAGNCALNYCTVNTGTAAAISISGGSTLSMDSCGVSSSNTNIITGAGTLIKGVITSIFGVGGSYVINTTTQNVLPTNMGGISFDGGANLLQNYAEGTWTPTFTGGSVAGTTTYTTQVGQYTRIGRLCICSVSVAWSNATGTGIGVIGGLPFTVKNATTPNFVNPVACQNVALTANYTMTYCNCVINTTTANTGQSGGTAAVNLAALNVWTVGQVTGTIIYNI